MTKRKNIKSTLIYVVISLIILLIASLSLLYFFTVRDTEWEYSYETDTVKYIYENMYEVPNNRYVWTAYVYEVVPLGDNIVIGTFPYVNEVKLIFNKDKIDGHESLSYIETEFGNLSSVFFSIQLKEDKGNIFEVFKCAINEESRCTIQVSLLKTDMYQNEYPYPTLSEQESRDFALYNIMKYEKEDIEEKSIELRCNDYMSEYIISKDRNTLEKIKSLNCTNYPINILYANMVGEEDPFYKYIKEKECPYYLKFKEKDIEKVLTSTTASILTSMCGVTYKGLSNDKEYVEDDIQLIGRNILFTLSDKEIPEYNERINNVKEILTREIFTSFPSPMCSIERFCSIELINLSMIVFNEN